MTQTQQPEALRLAHALSGGKLIDDSTEWMDTLHAAAEELPPKNCAANMPSLKSWKLNMQQQMRL